jgi:hypothetical protein
MSEKRTGRPRQRAQGSLRMSQRDVGEVVDESLPLRHLFSTEFPRDSKRSEAPTDCLKQSSEKRTGRPRQRAQGSLRISQHDVGAEVGESLPLKPL